MQKIDFFSARFKNTALQQCGAFGFLGQAGKRTVMNNAGQRPVPGFGANKLVNKCCK
jgi:hypothetical protein